MIIELVGFIMAFVYKGQLKDVYETALLEIFNRGLETNNQKIIGAFHELEKNLKCCGIHNISDYKAYNTTIDFSEGCQKYPLEGCSAKMIDLLNTSLPIVGYSLLVIFLVEFFGVLAAVVLAVALKHASKAKKETLYTSSPGEKLGYNDQPQRRANYPH